jgi:hypothetical protein
VKASLQPASIRLLETQSVTVWDRGAVARITRGCTRPLATLTADEPHVRPQSTYAMNLLTLALIAIVALGLPTLYFAWRSREFRKFLAGAFFVSAGIQFYLYLAKVSVPLLGTDLVLTPEVSGLRSIPHFIFFWICLYFGFIKKPKGSS